MEMKGEKSFNEFSRVQTKDFAIELICYCMKLPKPEASRARKKQYAKGGIVVKEADEAMFWPKMIQDTGIHRSAGHSRLKEGTESIVSVVFNLCKKIPNLT